MRCKPRSLRSKFKGNQSVCSLFLKQVQQYKIQFCGKYYFGLLDFIIKWRAISQLHIFLSYLFVQNLTTPLVYLGWEEKIRKNVLFTSTNHYVQRHIYYTCLLIIFNIYIRYNIPNIKTETKKLYIRIFSLAITIFITYFCAITQQTFI